jgi:hypothetical protein
MALAGNVGAELTSECPKSAVSCSAKTKVGRSSTTDPDAVIAAATAANIFSAKIGHWRQRIAGQLHRLLTDLRAARGFFSSDGRRSRADDLNRAA